MDFIIEQTQPPTIDDLRILTSRQNGRLHASLDVAERLRVENRNQEQHPICRLARLNICWRIQSKRMNNIRINARRSGKNDAATNYLCLSHEIGIPSRLQLADVFLNNAMVHDMVKQSNNGRRVVQPILFRGCQCVSRLSFCPAQFETEFPAGQRDGKVVAE